MQTRILTLSIAASRSRVFNFLADIENFPAWTGGLCDRLELHREGWWAYTELGELAVTSRADDATGWIEHCLTPTHGRYLLIPLHVWSDREAGTLVKLTCVQPPDWPEANFVRVVEGLLVGLRGLTGRCRGGRGDSRDSEIRWADRSFCRQ